jgi:acid phosphatase type 7
MRRKVVGAIAVAAAAALATGLVAAGSSAGADRTSRASIRLVRVKVQGQIAKVRPRIHGWRTGARWRIFVDGRYNNFSTRPDFALALNLRPGRHRVSADLIVGARRSRRSHPIKIVVKPAAGKLVAAVGDMACDPADPAFRGGAGTATACRGREVASLIAAARPSLLLALGDLQYECGGISAYAQSYARIFGRFKSITRPILGNHDYRTFEHTPYTPTCDGASGQGYFDYFGAPAAGPGGYYSYDVGSWHVVAINSECDHVGGCGVGSPEELWLRADLAAHPQACTLAYWHEPRWTGSTSRRPNPAPDAFWRDAAAAGVDVVLVGHHHLYERLTPLDANGRPSNLGIRQFTVGTGGRNLFGGNWLPIARAHEATLFGILLLTLRNTGYDWQFEPQHGAVFTDYGTGGCH